MNNQNQSSRRFPAPVAIGIDWANAEQMVCIIDQNDQTQISTLQQSFEASASGSPNCSAASLE